MKHFTSLALTLAGLSLSSLINCSGMQTTARQDPDADFSKYKTYAWAPADTAAPNAEAAARKQLIDKTIKAAADQQLTAKGLSKVEPDKADLLLSYSGTTQDKIIIRSVPYEPGAAGPTTMTREADSYKEGQLSLDLRDRATKQPVWEATATDAIGDSGATQDQIAQAVTQLLEKYPAS